MHPRILGLYILSAVWQDIRCVWTAHVLICYRRGNVRPSVLPGPHVWSVGRARRHRRRCRDDSINTYCRGHVRQRGGRGDGVVPRLGAARPTIVNTRARSAPARHHHLRCPPGPVGCLLQHLHHRLRVHIRHGPGARRAGHGLRIGAGDVRAELHRRSHGRGVHLAERRWGEALRVCGVARPDDVGSAVHLCHSARIARFARR